MKEQDIKIAEEAMWLVFQAAIPVGMGFLEADSAREMTKKKLIKLTRSNLPDGRVEYTADQITGRLLDIFLKEDKEGNLMYSGTIKPESQTWYNDYPTSKKLFSAAKKSLGDVSSNGKTK